MSIYAVILQEPAESVWQKIKETWPDRHYLWHDYTAFIAPSGITTTAQVRDILGLSAETQKKSGLVSELSPAYTGYANASLVEWMRNAEKASS